MFTVMVNFAGFRVNLNTLWWAELSAPVAEPCNCCCGCAACRLALVQFVMYNLAVVLIFAVNHALYYKS